MKFYDAPKPLCLEMDTSIRGIGASSLQIREGMNYRCDEVLDNVTLCPIGFASKSLSNVEQYYSNIDREALGILHGLK